MVVVHDPTCPRPAAGPAPRRADRGHPAAAAGKGAAVSTREIAEAAGIAEGTIFRVYESKDELIAACIQQAFDSEMLRAALRDVDRGLPLPIRLVAAVDLLQAHMSGLFSLMITLRTSGQSMPTAPPGRRPTTPAPTRGQPSSSTPR